MLYGLAALLGRGSQVDREQFRRCLEQINLGARHPGLTGVSFSRRVSFADKAGYERRAAEELVSYQPSVVSLK